MRLTETTPDEFEAHWFAGEMPAKLANGTFTEIIAYGSPATNPRYAGGVSEIVKLLTPNGRHIGTLHRITMPDGSVPHEHPKDYTLRDCSRVFVRTVE